MTRNVVRVRCSLFKFRHGRAIGSVGDRRGRYDRQFEQRPQFRQRYRIGPQFHHAYVFHGLKKTRLVVQQQYKSVGWIN